MNLWAILNDFQWILAGCPFGGVAVLNCKDWFFIGLAQMKLRKRVSAISVGVAVGVAL
jgi:hypothetical protein